MCWKTEVLKWLSDTNENLEFTKVLFEESLKEKCERTYCTNKMLEL
jgi:hypothetical protein